MIQAKVKWYDYKKGFGFAEVPNVEGDVMVHHSIIQMEGFRHLKAGQSIEITEIQEDERGKRAVSVTPQ